MNTINNHQFHRLLESEGGPHVSIFVPAPADVNNPKHESLRLRHLHTQARDALVQYWMREQDADAFLAPLGDLESDDRFLSARRSGVAIYRSEHSLQTYRVDDIAEEACFVGRAFLIRPIVGEVARSRFHVLTLSQNRVALISTDGETLVEVPVPGLPESFANESAVTTADRGSQVHSSGRGTVGKQAGVFHGQGGQADAEKPELREYLRRVDHAVTQQLEGRDETLILAGVDYVTSMYREVTTFPRLAEATISGNVDNDPQDLLMEKASSVIADELDQRRDALVRQIAEPVQQRVTTDPEHVLASAFQGSVGGLLFVRSGELFGSFDTEINALKQTHQPPSGDPADPNHDLIEMAIVQTLRHRGAVTAVEDHTLPADTLLAASLRY